jgi:hypothetical protein
VDSYEACVRIKAPERHLARAIVEQVFRTRIAASHARLSWEKSELDLMWPEIIPSASIAEIVGAPPLIERSEAWESDQRPLQPMNLVRGRFRSPHAAAGQGDPEED